MLAACNVRLRMLAKRFYSTYSISPHLLHSKDKLKLGEHENVVYNPNHDEKFYTKSAVLKLLNTFLFFSYNLSRMVDRIDIVHCDHIQRTTSLYQLSTTHLPYLRSLSFAQSQVDFTHVAVDTICKFAWLTRLEITSIRHCVSNMLPHISKYLQHLKLEYDDCDTISLSRTQVQLLQYFGSNVHSLRYVSIHLDESYLFQERRFNFVPELSSYDTSKTINSIASQLLRNFDSTEFEIAAFPFTPFDEPQNIEQFTNSIDSDYHTMAGERQGLCLHCALSNQFETMSNTHPSAVQGTFNIKSIEGEEYERCNAIDQFSKVNEIITEKILVQEKGTYCLIDCDWMGENLRRIASGPLIYLIEKDQVNGQVSIFPLQADYGHLQEPVAPLSYSRLKSLRVFGDVNLAFDTEIMNSIGGSLKLVHFLGEGYYLDEEEEERNRSIGLHIYKLLSKATSIETLIISIDAVLFLSSSQLLLPLIGKLKLLQRIHFEGGHPFRHFRTYESNSTDHVQLFLAILPTLLQSVAQNCLDMKCIIWHVGFGVELNESWKDNLVQCDEFFRTEFNDNSINIASLNGLINGWVESLNQERQEE